jgi:hypothetical protein
MNRPRVQCLDCGHIGYAKRKEIPKTFWRKETLILFLLLFLGLVPGIIYIVGISIQDRLEEDRRTCEGCGSGAITPFRPPESSTPDSTA